MNFYMEKSYCTYLYHNGYLQHLAIFPQYTEYRHLHQHDMKHSSNQNNLKYKKHILILNFKSSFYDTNFK